MGAVGETPPITNTSPVFTDRALLAVWTSLKHLRLVICRGWGPGLLKYLIIGRGWGGGVHLLSPHSGRSGVYTPNVAHSYAAGTHTKELSGRGGRSCRGPLPWKGKISAKVDGETMRKPWLGLRRNIWSWSWDVMIVTDVTRKCFKISGNF